jgi:formamidopyrimidine-DNA glycosylase
VKVSKHPLRRRWTPAWTQALAGRRVLEVRRRGKWIVVDLDDGRLLIHLGMTGQLTVVPADAPVVDHTHVIFNLAFRDNKRPLASGNHKRPRLWSANQLRFRDVRRFGSMALFPSQSVLEEFFRDSKLGPEPFDLGPHYWHEHLKRTSRCLKAVLLDQRTVAGVGNIYADESLFEARLHPAQLGRATSLRQAHRLQQAVVTVLERAIDKRGSSIRDYIGGNGAKGAYQDEFRVYGRTGEPCVRCGTAIECIRLAGRSTHYCARCQRMRLKIAD